MTKKVVAVDDGRRDQGIEIAGGALAQKDRGSKVEVAIILADDHLPGRA